MPLLASLLPPAWFDLPSIALVAIAAFCLFVVIKGADWLVEAAASVAKKLGMPEVIIGATIVSLGTTAPETAVSVLAAFSGNAGLALGNGVGSIIADTGLIFGVGLLLAKLPADKFVLNRQGWVQAGSAILLAAICYGLYAAHGNAMDENGVPLAKLPRYVGFLFLGLLVGYLALSVKWSRQHPTPGSSEPHLATENGTVQHDHEKEHNKPLAVLLGMGLIGLALVVVGGDAMVNSVIVLAERGGIPQSVIASTIVALGTSLPELVVGITAIRKKHPELLVGNVIGADILNVLFVIGAACVAAPLPVIDPQTTADGVEVTLKSKALLLAQLPTMLVLLVFMRLYIFKATKTGHFSRWMGIPMVAVYVAFLIGSYLLGSGGGGH